MLKKLRNRFIACFMIIAIVFVIVGVQLGNLTMAQGDDLATQSEERTVRSLTLKGSRGKITDITGIPLAYDEISYNVEFTRDPSKNTTTDRAYYTDVLVQTINMIEQNGGTVIDTFNIVRNDDGSFAFDFGVKNEESKKTREENWRENMFVSTKPEVGADMIYRDLRDRYRIPEEYTYEQARKLLSIWQEVQLSSYKAYVPTVIAKNIPMDTVAIIEANSANLDGIGVAAASTRVYPKDSVAAHIIGNTGRMVDENVIKEMEAKGYSQDDTMGTSGIEATQEAFLTGNSKERQGKREVEVNSKGKVIQELSYTPPTQGNDVMLTINLDMQMALEKYLENNVKKVYDLQLEKYYEAPQEYDESVSLKSRKGDATLDKINLAKSGAAVVMDVHTGDVLAMANYPSYDLNIFAKGISEADMKALSEDPAAPLFNKAIASKGIPGSIFKMVTGMGGLMEGEITGSDIINDEGEFSVDVAESYVGTKPACWVRPDFSAHQDNQTITKALSRSCNYFFFEVATRLGIDRLVDWADRFGLMTKTNIELTGEQSGQVGNQSVLYDPNKTIGEQKTAHPKLVRNQILNQLTSYGEDRNVQYDKELLEQTADELVALISLNKYALGPEIRNILYEKMEIPATISQRDGYDTTINQYLTQLMWNATRTALTGIGTDITAVTPIGVARYVSALVNGGYVYDAHIVDSIVDANGNVVQKTEPQVWSKIDAPQEYFDLIKQGMKEVVSAEDGGTAGKSFSEWKYKDQIGGKTGTGKVSKDVDLENNAWFVAFAPYDNPEIAVVSYIPNGLGGNYAIDTAKDIIEYYLDGKNELPTAVQPTANALLNENVAPPKATASPAPTDEAPTGNVE